LIKYYSCFNFVIIKYRQVLYSTKLTICFFTISINVFILFLSIQRVKNIEKQFLQQFKIYLLQKKLLNFKKREQNRYTKKAKNYFDKKAIFDNKNKKILFIDRIFEQVRQIAIRAI